MRTLTVTNIGKEATRSNYDRKHSRFRCCPKTYIVTIDADLRAYMLNI